MIKIQVSKTLQRKIRKGFPWVFHYHVENKKVIGSPGDLGVIYDSQNRFLAIGLYDPFSDIRLRILQTGTPVEIGEPFFKERLQRAQKIREKLKTEKTTGYRVINGENDGFPGLILDRYEQTGVLKLYSAAWIPYLDTLLPVLRKELSLARCVLRIGRKTQIVMKKEGNFCDGQILFGSQTASPVRFQENGLYFEADVQHGGKTGFFLDQRDNRKLVSELSGGKSVLNAFSFTGAFSVFAFAGGCRSVLELDINSHAMKTSRRILKMNFPDLILEPPTFRQIQGDAFQLLTELIKRKEMFDLVILDPPSFAGNKKQKPQAMKAYCRLAEMGSRLTRKGGILFAASCSAHVSADEFFKSVNLGIESTGRSPREIRRTSHAIDHPVDFEEGRYLKGLFCSI